MRRSPTLHLLEVLMRGIIVGLALVLLLPVSPLPAQEVQSTDQSLLQPGARVRVSLVSAEQSRLVGNLRSFTPDALVLQGQRGEADRTLPFREAQQLEVSRGRQRALWSAMGTLSGAVAGVVFTRATHEDDPADIGGLQGTADGVGNTLTGMLLGGAIGWLLAPERWREVPIPNRPR